MFGFLKQVGDYSREAAAAARGITQGVAVTFDHMRRSPMRVQYP
ncbi:MAG: NAD(P)H-quinone oxidoreductase subunit I, partial [Cyanobacteria bacterium MAG IRC1_bin_28]|nr:NAD(P)H-quinone oxidoreductase subunit I [Cyanobacteria bacterium MAG IRC1_bin_28]